MSAQDRQTQIPFDELVNQLVEPAFVIDANHTVLVWNRAVEVLTGMKADDVVGTSEHWRAFYRKPRPCLADLVASGDTDAVARLYAATDNSCSLYGGLHAENWCEMPLRDINLYLSIDAGPICDADGKVIAVVEMLRDWTDWKNSETQLRLIESVFRSSSEGIVITNAASEIISVNAAFTQLTGYTEEEVLGRNPRFLRSGMHDDAFFSGLWRALREEGCWHGELWNRRKNGEMFPERMAINAVRDDKGLITHYVGIFSDITAQKQVQEQLETMATHDVLTGLPNRVALSGRLHQALALARSRDGLVAVCFVDLDEFKPVNDTYGHEAGDQVLLEVAHRLKRTIRSSDTVARIGGDEFILLLTDFSRMDEIDQALERILDILRQPIALAQANVTISASIGVTVHPLDESDTDTLIRHADQAMYVAKNMGRNNWRLYDSSSEQQASKLNSILAEVREGLQRGQLRLYYQPKVNLRSGEVVGMEALVRWQHPERGIVPPGDFLPQVQNSPLIVDLGEWVIHEALAQLSRWLAQGLNMRVSVNIAARQFQHIDFVMRLRSILGQYPDVPPSLLEIEVLESTAFDDVENVRAVLLSCLEMGVGCALDDFGTGYSTLTYLRRIPARDLKIDQTFIRDMLNDEEDLALVEGIIGLAHVFQMGIVAEGVETREHGIVLMRIGCDIVQGYFISRPMPADQVAGWCAAFRPDPAWVQWAERSWDRSHLPLVLAEYDCLKSVQRAQAALDDPKMELAPYDPGDPAASRFGQWLTREGQRQYGHLEVFSETTALHARLHAEIAEIARLRASGDIETARTLAVALPALRHALIEHLARMHDVLLDGNLPHPSV